MFMQLQAYSLSATCVLSSRGIAGRFHVKHGGARRGTVLVVLAIHNAQRHRRRTV